MISDELNCNCNDKISRGKMKGWKKKLFLINCFILTLRAGRGGGGVDFNKSNSATKKGLVAKTLIEK